MLTGKKFSRYEIRSKIGAGGMGEIYEAFDAELGRRVAVKLLPHEFSGDDERAGRFRQEARAASALNHPNIITIYEIGENEDGNFLVTEFIEGRTLREIIRSETLSLVRVLKIIEQAADALASAHAAGIVHRDIKPENIMVRGDGIVKVLDFGLAKPVANEREDADAAVKTVPGMVLGSARYMSPEQARGVEVDTRTDVWSLGVLLYEMVTGRAAFSGETVSDTIAAVIYKEPEPIAPNAASPPMLELQRIVCKALQKERGERYQTAKDFALDVKNLLYEIEHEISAERMRQQAAELDISENPTMLHQTVSTGHPAGRSTSSVKADAPERPAPPPKSSLRKYALTAAAAIVLFIGLGFGFYSLFEAGTENGAAPFEKMHISMIGTDGKTFAPAISPDGRYIAYLSGEIGRRSLTVRQVSTDSAVEIVAPTSSNLFGVSFSPDGDYVYYLQSSDDFVINTLYRIPTLGGEPKKLIEDVDSAVTFSPDGRQIAFQRNISNEAIVTIYTADADGGNVRELLRSDQTPFNVLGNPQWSPGGARILVRAFNSFGGTVDAMHIAEIGAADRSFAVFGEKEMAWIGSFCWFRDGSGFLFLGQDSRNSPVQIWRADYRSREAHPVTNDINNYTALGLSADGKTIVTLKNNASSSVWRFNPVNRQMRQLTAESQNQEGSAGLLQMPDGSVFHTRKNGHEIGFWTMSAEASDARQLTSEKISPLSPPVATADGRYIVFSSRHSGAARIWRMDADGKNLVQLTKEKPNYGDFSPQLLPDGKTVIYQETASGANSQTVLMKISIDGGEAEVFHADERYSFHLPAVSPDGKYLAHYSYRKSDFVKKIRLVALDGGRYGSVIKEFSADAVNFFTWSPDGRSLTILSNRNGVPNLWRMPIESETGPQPITDFKAGRIFNFAWSRDGKTLFIVRGNVNSDLILIRDLNAAGDPGRL